MSGCIDVKQVYHSFLANLAHLVEQTLLLLFQFLQVVLDFLILFDGLIELSGFLNAFD